MGANGESTAGAAAGITSGRSTRSTARSAAGEIGAAASRASLGAVPAVPLPRLRRARGVGMIPGEDLDRFEAWLVDERVLGGSREGGPVVRPRADRLGAVTADEVNAATRIPGTEFPHFAQTTRSGMRRALDLFEEFRGAVPA